MGMARTAAEHFHVSCACFKQKIAADDTLIFLFYLSEDSQEISSLIFSENNEEVFMNVACCSRDWCFEETVGQYLDTPININNAMFQYQHNMKNL